MLHSSGLAASAALLFALLGASAASAQEQRLAVLALRNKISGPARDGIDAEYFTDQIREAALPIAKRRRIAVMSRENLFELLKSTGKKLEECEGECEVETGRRIGADFIVSGDLVKVGATFKASLRLHETAKGSLLAARTAAGKTVEELDANLVGAVRELLAPLGPAVAPEVRIEGTEGKIGGGTAESGPTGADEFVVKLESEPPGAVVMLDGQMLCQSTPCSRAVAVGEHDFSFQREGYESAVQRAAVKKGAQVTVKLARIAALVTVETEPTGLPISIDGKAAGTSPLAARQLPPGAHEIVVDDKCYQREGERVVLKKGEDRTVRIAARPRTASVKISAADESGNAVEGEAEIDRKALGAVPGTYRVAICAKELRITSGRLRGSERLALEEGKAVAARLKLKSIEASSGEEMVEPRSGLTFVRMPGGTFHFGCEPQDGNCSSDEKPGRTERVGAFWLGKTEVTARAYQKCVEAGGCTAVETDGVCSDGSKPDHPVICVDWTQASAFCAWTGGRLPTGVEWEYAAKSGESRVYPWGTDAPGARACWNGKGNDLGEMNRRGTCAVGSHKQGDSKWGLHDMAGNVEEWTASDAGAGKKEIRGGTWPPLDPKYMRASHRAREAPTDRYFLIGFRCGL